MPTAQFSRGISEYDNILLTISWGMCWCSQSMSAHWIRTKSKKDKGIGAQQWYQSQLAPEDKGLEINKEKEAELPLHSTPTFEGPIKVPFRYLRVTPAKPNDVKPAGAFWLVSRQNLIGIMQKYFDSDLLETKSVCISLKMMWSQKWRRNSSDIVHQSMVLETFNNEQWATEVEKLNSSDGAAPSDSEWGMKENSQVGLSWGIWFDLTLMSNLSNSIQA